MIPLPMRALAERARWRRLRTGTQKRGDIEAVSAPVLRMLDPRVARLEALSRTFDNAPEAVARRCAAQRVIVGQGEWAADGSPGGRRRTLGPAVIESLAAAYGVPLWFLRDIDKTTETGIALDHEIRLLRLEHRFPSRYGPHSCTPDSPLDPSDELRLLTAARRALDISLLRRVVTGVGAMALFALLSMIAILSPVRAALPIGGLTVFLFFVLCAHGEKWMAGMRTTLTSRRLARPELSRAVQARLQQYIGENLPHLLGPVRTRCVVQRVLCHGAPIGYETLTLLTSRPRAMLRCALGAPLPSGAPPTR
ncbi:hypothetical protein [Microbacterium maritypicum]|uniref:hypothetical protein n=1 Tax=Microbacterium maritypicum TaxID=33918 RepID=UPI003A8EB026